MKLAAFHFTASGRNQVVAAATVAEAYTVIDRRDLRIWEVEEIEAEDFDIWREKRLRPEPDSLETIQRTYRSLGYANNNIEIPAVKDWVRRYFDNRHELYASHSTRQFYRISE